MPSLRELLPKRIRRSYALTFLTGIVVVLLVMGSISAYAYTDSQESVKEDVAGVSAQTTAEAQNVSAASEEQTSSLTEVSTSVQSLADRAERLHSLLEQFEVQAASAPTDAGAETAADAAPAAADGGESAEAQSDD
ncbi:hypothetical protein [Halopelagius fulvigenes]|uniref:Methyl-accepting chemotaxis protein n=1 Tax=Halopelagius fulvigenes TaxID=1198324 RepID=A0ABD5U4G1_9EURY